MTDHSYRDRMHSRLTLRLKKADGHTLECGHDTVVIEKLGRRSIRVVLKDAAVTREDVSRFDVDTSRSGCHGIMCTSESKVAHPNFIDFRRLGDTYAFYLVNVGDNADTVVAFVRVLYGFDDMKGSDPSGEQLKKDVENIKKACKTERDIVREAVALGKYEKMKVLQTMYDIRDDDSRSGSGTVRVGGKAAAGRGGALPPCESEDVIQSYAVTQSRGEASTSAHAATQSQGSERPASEVGKGARNCYKCARVFDKVRGMQKHASQYCKAAADAVA